MNTIVYNPQYLLEFLQSQQYKNEGLAGKQAICLSDKYLSSDIDQQALFQVLTGHCKHHGELWSRCSRRTTTGLGMKSLRIREGIQPSRHSSWEPAPPTCRLASQEHGTHVQYDMKRDYSCRADGEIRVQSD